MSDVYTCNPFKNPTMDVSIVDALMIVDGQKKLDKSCVHKDQLISIQVEGNTLGGNQT